MEGKFTYKFNIFAFIGSILGVAIIMGIVVTVLKIGNNPALSSVIRVLNLLIGLAVAKYFSKEQVAKRKEEVEK